MHVQKNTELHFHSHCAEKQRIWGVIPSLCSILPTLKRKIFTESTFPFDLMNRFILQTQTAFLALLHVASGVQDPPELHRKVLSVKSGVVFSYLDLIFPKTEVPHQGK